MKKQTSQITVNAMILNTLKTKITKTPKYKEVLESLGYTLDKDHGWSTYDYWGIKTYDGRTLVISKSRGNQRTLYKTAKPIHTSDISKVDFEKLLKTNRQPLYHPRFFGKVYEGRNCVGEYVYFSSKRIYDYYRLKENMKVYKGILRNYQEQKEKAEEALKRIEKQINYYVDSFDKYSEEYLNLFNK